ncbi:glycosyltransferase [uncultured Zobellia sp.]|uniref:glycosyltransferase n=1 Tax=uncultured Zobellia sp. TaxID=255433 RepID=UPI002597C91C|nr:glycosyltransferase [uncultured Zobellia sp.]
MNNLTIGKRSFAEYNLVSHYAKELSANTVYLMHFNAIQLALVFKRPQFKIKGILFNQFFRMNPKNWKEKLKYYRKYLITKLYCTNSAVESVFILNDTKSVSQFNEKFVTNIFKAIPDPIPELKPLVGFVLRKKYNLGSDKKIFLHFGSLAARKGTLETIEATTMITKEKQAQMVLLLVGNPENVETEQKILNSIDKAKKSSYVNIIWEKKFVSNSLMKSLFLQCTSVVMPYKNPEASSGILGHALAAKKAVITTGKGLLRELVENNNFGILLDNVTPEEIAKAMSKIENSKADNKAYSDYLKEHTPTKFSKTLLK